MAAKSFRMKFMFWLDTTKADEEQLIEQVEALKQTRLFSKTIRDGIRLICDLRAGQTDILFELFPWVRDSLNAASTPAIDKNLQEQIARLEAILLAQGNVPIQLPTTSAPDQTPLRTERVNSIPLVEITEPASKTSSAEVVAKNFLSSMKGLASGFFD